MTLKNRPKANQKLMPLHQQIALGKVVRPAASVINKAK